MAIPKVIYQTYKTDRLPLLTRWQVWRMRRRHPGYRYEFYDDTRIESFLGEAYPSEVLQAYRRI